MPQLRPQRQGEALPELLRQDTVPSFPPISSARERDWGESKPRAESLWEAGRGKYIKRELRRKDRRV